METAPRYPEQADLKDAIFREPIPWAALSGPLAAAEDALARLDERLRSSPIAEGWISRTHFQDACASLWLAGELVSLEDLVLHDARMDVRSPTHELTRAQAVLRTRRRIAGAAPDWAMSAEGLKALRGDGDSGTSDARTRGGGGKSGDDDNAGFCPAMPAPTRRGTRSDGSRARPAATKSSPAAWPWRGLCAIR